MPYKVIKVSSGRQRKPKVSTVQPLWSLQVQHVTAHGLCISEMLLERKWSQLPLSSKVENWWHCLMSSITCRNVHLCIFFKAAPENQTIHHKIFFHTLFHTYIPWDQLDCYATSLIIQLRLMASLLGILKCPLFNVIWGKSTLFS